MAYSPGPAPQPGYLTPRSFNTLSPPLVHTPGAHDITPTPIHEILRDPTVLSSLLSQRKKARRASSSSQTPRGRAPQPEDIPPLPDRDLKPPRKEKRDRERERDSDSASILTHVLAEEERQARHLKAVLRQTGARLEEELRRADLAESRARTAEITSQDVSARLAASEAARHQMELDVTRAQEECRRWQMQADAADRETRRVQAELARSERARMEKDEEVKEARDHARRAEQTLREWQAREAGREEVRRLELRRRATDHRDESYESYEDGRAEGYDAGRTDGYEEGMENGRTDGYETGRSEGFAAGRMTGFEEGKKVGAAEGYQAGYAQGRKEERARALDAFDRFIETEMDHRTIPDERDDRTQRWVEATRKMREREPSPLPAPMRESPPPPIRVPSPGPPPKLVWLHRPLNRHQEPAEAARGLPAIPEQRA
ncbi:hypothetical protein C2E23DRAFT_869337 [Lenzites betulinus]|nr:hypothetical protein C2E23DRAFT_869337 [Lenzites betulinus]